ncbi:MAG: leucine-rich repeat domain-containing protein [Bacteroidales bacterium]|nr:leucine-rich repeat domain-containing protein [Bacteroidales bacterium]
MTLKSKPYNERRLYRTQKWSFLLDDDDNSAWIVKGHIGRCKKFQIPKSIEIDGRRYEITSIEIGAFNSPKTLRHLSIPDSIEYVDEDEFIFMPNLRSIYVGKGVKHLADWHFRRSDGSAPLFIDKENPNLKPSNNLLLTGDGKTVLRTMKRCRSYVIPEGVERIYALNV